MYQHNNSNIHYRINGGEWITPPQGSGGLLQEVISVNGPTEVILDWVYNTGFQNGWHYDVDYTRATSGGGQSRDETVEVGKFRLDASNDWKWVWTDRKLDQDHVDTYFFENVREYTADGTAVGNFDGFMPPEVGQLTQGTDGKWTAAIINEQILTGVALPNTGGSGTTLIYFTGLILTAVGCIGLEVRRRRRNVA